MNLVFGSFCPLHEGNKYCPCRFAVLSPSEDTEDVQLVDINIYWDLKLVLPSVTLVYEYLELASKTPYMSSCVLL